MVAGKLRYQRVRCLWAVKGIYRSWLRDTGSNIASLLSSVLSWVPTDFSGSSAGVKRWRCVLLRSWDPVLLAGACFVWLFWFGKWQEINAARRNKRSYNQAVLITKAWYIGMGIKQSRKHIFSGSSGAPSPLPLLHASPWEAFRCIQFNLWF